MHSRRTVLALVLAAGGFVSLAASQAPHPAPTAATVDDQARLLAGLPVSAGSPLVTLEKSAPVIDHATQIDKAWRLLDDVLLSSMRAWSATNVAPRINPSAPLCYIFGGPDILMANAMFPSAPVYLLTGLEPVGRVPALETLPAKALQEGLDNLRASTAELPTRGYFITSYMQRDLYRTQLTGVLPVFYLFLARTGHRVLDSRRVYIDAAGQVKDAPVQVPADGVGGVKVLFQRDGAAAQTLYYFTVDLEAKAIARKRGFFAFLNAQPSPNAYLKAASFILHDNNFLATRAFLLSHSAAILQDDSGVPFRLFQKNAWDLTLFGIYEPATWIEHFEWVTQSDLKAAFDAAGTLPALPFKTGYSKPGRSNLMLAVKKRPAGTTR